MRLRLDAHAQKEIRDYAQVLLDIAKIVAPAACTSFENHKKGGVNFSKAELDELRLLLDGKEGRLSGKEKERFDKKIDLGRQV